MTHFRNFFTRKRVRLMLLSLALLLSGFALYLDITVRMHFEGKRWAMPARVYARPLELYPGMKLRPEQLSLELAMLDYRVAADPREPGSYRRQGDEFTIVTRPFKFWDEAQPALTLQADFSGTHMDTLTRQDTGKPVTLARLDPVLIGGIYPAHNEDRVLVRFDEIPPHLVKGLIAIEDRQFYSHHGFSARGTARALVTIVRGGGIQGGSTLTQQLVKNFFLTPERTLRRKFTELLMAMLLELHYAKDEILEAYANEIYLGQDGNRAIHGFGLASHFYFDRPLSRLDLPQAALLVGLVKGPSSYDPRRQPARALARRNLVLQEMRKLDFITQAQYVAARAAPLGVVEKAPEGTSRYPAFVELVHRQLRRDYREDDLRSEGLQIFTTLDPLAQTSAERALTGRLTQLEKDRRLPPKSLEGAIVISHSQNGEVQALVGGRNTRFEGFNRALDAARPIGSLIKPVVYLTALERPGSYTLATLLDDSPLVWKSRGTDDWKPENYDKEFHGQVPLRVALANSYNVSTARLGLALGVRQVMDKAHRLGVERDLQTFASSLLGADSLSPLEVAQMYQTFASGGFRVPLRAIREVMMADGQPLQRYPLSVEQVIEPGPAYLVTQALQTVVQEGTADALKHYLSPDLRIAGKTGTTNDLRDSWFAGYTGDRLAVVWIGRDDNQPIQMTGAGGAMTVWGEMMARLDPDPLIPPVPENIESAWIDPATGLRADASCAGAIELPFIRGSAPTETAPCGAGSPVRTIKSWFERIFE
ncbi:penicillin-binding protein 1B [Sulfuricaulis limicola]|uniref:Penicillin-binding protein 1B n=1 Tax=Sulfuricaulis limicola TaxID=1620215 RepID=A0A1B4XGA3_9GAMM|nr:penicillin-binding protein 1B [Sulfuricaulis limicola]BAV33819.1 penicillin-binding protein 1B [Sulfuricaulis limicola]